MEKENQGKKILIEALKYKSSGDVIDLGAGDGNDSLFFSKKGFNVTAIDNIEQNIHDILQLNKINNVKINAKLEDLKKIKFDKKYDVVLSNYVFHFLREKDARNLIKKMKDNTKPGGLNIITGFTDEIFHQNFKFVFKPLELKNIYKDFEILFYDEYCSPIKPHLTIKPESIVELIARKRE